MSDHLDSEEGSEEGQRGAGAREIRRISITRRSAQGAKRCSMRDARQQADVVEVL